MTGGGLEVDVNDRQESTQKQAFSAVVDGDKPVNAAAAGSRWRMVKVVESGSGVKKDMMEARVVAVANRDR